MQERYARRRHPSDPDVFWEDEVQKELRMRWWEWLVFPIGALVIYALLFGFMLFF